jgi:hypothetical protein
MFDENIQAEGLFNKDLVMSPKGVMYSLITHAVIRISPKLNRHFATISSKLCTVIIDLANLPRLYPLGPWLNMAYSIFLNKFIPTKHFIMTPRSLCILCYVSSFLEPQKVDRRHR